MLSTLVIPNRVVAMRRVFFILFFFPLAVYGQQMAGNLLSPQTPTQVKVDNRILAYVNGKAITVLDLTKKMDLVLKREYPQFADNPIAKFQFYEGSWRPVFEELVDRELVLADSQRMGMKVSNGEIRQEMLSTFGPDVMNTLDQIALPYSEAWEMVESDMLIRRMTYARAHMKAFTKVHPADIRAAYQAYLDSFDDSQRLSYRVVTIRAQDESKGREIANSVTRQLEGGTDLQNAVDLVIKQIDADPAVSAKLSEKFVQKSSEIAPDYLDSLAELATGTVSTPVAQKSRTTGKTVYRIFLLEDRDSDPAQPFEDLEQLFNNRLIEHSVAEETSKYMKELRGQFNMTDERLNELLPKGFSPFTLN